MMTSKMWPLHSKMATLLGVYPLSLLVFRAVVCAQGRGMRSSSPSRSDFLLKRDDHTLLGESPFASALCSRHSHKHEKRKHLAQMRFHAMLPRSRMRIRIHAYTLALMHLNSHALARSIAQAHGNEQELTIAQV